MQVIITIPDEFITDWNKDRFDDALHRLSVDAHLIAGNYEQETAKMLAEAFKNAVQLDTDTVSRKQAIDALKEALNPSIANFVKAKIAIENLPPSPSRPQEPVLDSVQ